MRNWAMVLTCLAALPAHAEELPESDAERAEALGLSEDDLAVYDRETEEGGMYGRLLFGSSFGRGLRFNNPFRLSTQLSDDPQSVSLTASYWDAWAAGLLGEPNGFQHGAALHASVALEGVPQQALSLGYIGLYRGESRWMGYGRAAASLLTAPDVNLGGELAAGGAFFITGGLGVNLEVIGNLYYGAATYETEITTIPILSFQGGVIIDYEVLP